jgi:hypothetical protein
MSELNHIIISLPQVCSKFECHSTFLAMLSNEGMMREKYAV